MAITEETRHQLYRRLQTTLGGEDAHVLMQHLPPVGWADVATKADLLVLRSDLVHLETVLHKDLETTELRLQADMGEKFNRLLFQLLAAQAVFTTLVLAISRLS